MSQAAAPLRTLTLTEELERLEQSITLTLQEIDSNFAKAHRIVTGSILPTIEEYAKHSSNVWDSSKFWKQFFEASANVSLSGYEEMATDHLDESQSIDTGSQPVRHLQSGNRSPKQTHDNSEKAAENANIKPPWQGADFPATPQILSSTRSERPIENKAQTERFSATPRMYTGTKDFQSPLVLNTSTTPRSKIDNDLELDLSLQSDLSQVSIDKVSHTTNQQRHDAVMHRVLDKTYRMQVTPHRQRAAETGIQSLVPASVVTSATQPWADSPGSSPELAVPELRSDLFSPSTERSRIPGRSVLTPARPVPNVEAEHRGSQTRRKLFAMRHDREPIAAPEATQRMFFTEEDTEDNFMDQMSPPKTIQFHIPQSRLLQTPAREASRRIVDDLLTTAGMDNTDDLDEFDVSFSIPGSIDSPSVVRPGADANNDDTF